MERRFLSFKSYHWFAPIIVVAAFMAATWPSLVAVGHRWSKLDESYSHGFLLLAVSLVLFIIHFRRISPKAGFYPLWLVPLLAALTLYAIGSILRIQAAQQLMLVPLLLGCFAVIYGWQQVKGFIVPVGLLFFAIPVWDYLAWSLQMITVWVNQLWLSVPGIDFEVEGVFVYLTGVGAFEIAHGCSGLRYLLVGLTLSVLYGELNYRRGVSKAAMVAMAVFLALFANWLRVFIIIYMGYVTDMETRLIDDHDAFGWWVFAFTLLPLFLFGRWLEKHPREINAQPVAGHSTGIKGPGFSGLVSVSGVLLVSAVVMAADTDLTHGETHTLTLSPMPGGHWSPLYQRQLKDWAPRVQQPDWVYLGTFFNARSIEAGESPDITALVSLSSYEFQRTGREVIQYGNRLYDSRIWHPQKSYPIAMDNGVRLQGLTLSLRGGNEQLHVAYGYYVEGRWESDQLLAKLAQLHGVFNNRSDASLVAIGLHCQRCDGKHEITQLASQVQPLVQQALDQKFSR
ncbi:MAG: exosortase [Halomonadaceae bacterium]|nr:MAG: exosortase [Halomonadaceae bacterium]